MKPEPDKYRILLDNLPDAFAYHQIVTDEEGAPMDYIFLEINDAFEEMTGLKREKVIGKKVTAVLPGIDKSGFDWIGAYGQVALSGEPARFENYSESLGRWFDVSAYSEEPGYFAAIFRDVTFQKNEKLALEKLTELVQKNLESPAGDLDYQALADGLLKLSGVKFAAINTYELDGDKAVTRAISGVADSIRKVCDMLGIELVGKAWDIIPERLNEFKEGRLLRFANLYDCGFGAIPKKASVLLEKALCIGEVYVAAVGHEGKTFGDLIMFVPRGKTLKYPKVIELYAAQIGLSMMRSRAGKALAQSNENLATILENTVFGVTIIDKNRNIRWANTAALKLAAVEHLEDITGQHCSKYLCPAQQNECPILDKGQTIDNSEWILRRQDGKIIPILKTVTGINFAGEDVLLETFIDITAQKQADEALRESEHRYRDILESMEEGFYEVDLRGKIIACNKAATKFLGYEENELVGISYGSLCKDFASVYREFNQAFKAGEPKFSVIMEMIRKDGSTAIVDLSVTLTRDKQGKIAGFRGLGRDMTERINFEQQLKHLGLHDQLTGLYNRRYFENELQRIDGSREHPVTIISADLDGLKLINDTLGHSEGDHYLQAGAELLKSALRASDILARVGGDEFALILPRTTQEAGEELVARIHRQVEEYNRGRAGLPLSISIGLAVSESSEHLLEEAYKKADAVMYTDKLQRSKKARAEIVTSFLASLYERGDLGEGAREQVQELSIQLGQALILDDSRMADLELLAQVYDLGKVSLPDHVVRRSLLRKTGELTEVERQAIHQHPEIGYRIASSSPHLAGVAELILKHHENWDGSGYPLGLKGEEIPVECRILSIAIAYSAMVNSNAGKMNKTEILCELERSAGKQFDPELVPLMSEIADILIN